MSKIHTVVCINTRTETSVYYTGTIEQLAETFSYTLECGACYAREKGNVKINCKPGTIVSLIKNINNAVNNAAANGYAGKWYSAYTPAA